MIVFLSQARTLHTLPSCPSNTASHSHLPTPQSLAEPSQLPLTTKSPAGLMSNAQTLWLCPSSKASALSSGGLPGCRTSIMVSFPPETMRPSENSPVGGRYVIAFMKAEPWEDIEQSYLGGFSARSFHWRTVASRDAETMTVGCGKTTPRTYLEVK